MIQRNAALRVARLAGEILENSGTRSRVENGYTRVDPIAIAESEGIDVMARPLDKLLGAFLREERVGILLNNQRPSGMFHMTCAHELGHFYLGHLTSTDEHLDYRADASEAELEADQFAYALMAPLWLIARVLKAQGWGWNSMRDPSILYQLSLRLGLSYSATLWSLVRLRKLDSNVAKTLAKHQPAEIKLGLIPQGAILETNQDVWCVGPRDKDFILEPRPNDRIVADLPSHAAAGYLWSINEAQQEGYTLAPLTIDSHRRPAATSSDDVLIGGTPTIHYELKFTPSNDAAMPIMPTKVAFQEAQPWLPADAKGATKFTLQTKFEILNKGLSAASRERLVQRSHEA
ncbi:MAG: ImmA/IrrE family metallo-endopeptidase [Burkholderiaceae bacterium]|nr:ImmA/IrrE family metallo-endopeptidase [Burkholderiaceae bacterium]